MRLTANIPFIIGTVLVCIVILTAVFAPVIAPHGFREQNLRKSMQPPAWTERGELTHFLGTDYLGRDVLSRIIYGARVSASVGVFSVVVGGGVGTLLGLLAGYFGGRVDRIISRLIDIQLSFPPVFLAIAIMAAVEQNLINLILVLGLVTWVQFARVSRGQTLAVREQEYVQAATAVGAEHFRILFRHILPNILPPLIVIATVNMSAKILAEAALSFLGLGVQPPTPTWGGMISDAREIMGIAWWTTVFPGAAIVLFVVGANLMGEGLRRRT